MSRSLRSLRLLRPLRLAVLSHCTPAQLLPVTLLTLLPLAPLASAAPVDPLVRHGTATFAVNGNVYSVSNSPGAIIDWRQFNVAPGELLRFLQQDAQSTVLNRVTGADPSQILGALQSNGRVLLVNPNGVLFGANAVVDVAGLVVSGLRLSDADFLAGKYTFSGGSGAVSNLGSITTPLGGSVYLLGADVSNAGVIRAPGGQILLAAGHSVSLADSATPQLSVTLSAQDNRVLNLGELTAAGGRIDLYGALLDQQGIVRADSSSVDAEGRIVLKASQSSTLSGTLSARNADGVGGTVQVLGDQVTLSDSARIDVSGSGGGGTVLVGGDYQGRNPALPNASSTSVAAGASIDASAGQHGDGGKVVVWSNGLTRFDGLIQARGGALSGNGGLVETSGHVLRNGGRVDTRAPRGRTGNWLLDPGVYCFYSVSASECAGGADSTVDDINNIEDYLALSNATLQASNYISFLPAGGSATVDTAIPAGNTLTVLAPYIEIGPGAQLDTSAVGVALTASANYGRTTRTDQNGANLTGSISIAGMLTSRASQSLVADGGDLLIGAASGVHNAGLRMTASNGSQSLRATGLLDIRVDGTLAGSNITAEVSSAGKQSLSAERLTLRGGNGSSGADNSALLSSQGEQTINATDIALLAGGAGSAVISAFADGATQTLQSKTLTLHGGDAGLRNFAFITVNGLNTVQQITASTSLTILGGSDGRTNGAYIENFGSTANPGATLQNISTGALTLKGGATAGASAADGNFALLTAAGAQSITASSVLVQGGSSQQLVTDGTVSSAQITAEGNQSITSSGALTVTGGGGAGHSIATINSQGSQSIKAGNLTIAAGNAGVENAADIRSAKAQTVVVGGAIVLQAGAGGSDNRVALNLNGAVDATQSITAGSLSLLAGSGGSNNFVQVEAQGTRITQAIKADALLLQGGSGNNNWAHLWSDYNGTSATQQRVDAGSITLRGGSANLVLPDTAPNNDAVLASNGSQQITAASVSIAAAGSSASIQSETDQSLTLTGALNVQGGNYAGNTSFSTVGQVMTYGNQTISADSIAIQGGSAGRRNTGGIVLLESAASGRQQKISAPSITITGGDSGFVNIAMMMIYGSNVSQQISTNTLSLTGGRSGQGNMARLQAISTDGSISEQTINAPTITLLGGGSSAADSGSRASVFSGGNQTITSTNIVLRSGDSTFADAGLGAILNQTITATESLTIAAGAVDQTNAYIQQAPESTSGSQTISSNKISMSAASQGSGSRATIFSNSTAQRINLTGSNPQLLLTGGNGAGTADSAATILQFGSGTQSIAVNGGGSVKLRGGNGDGVVDGDPNASYCAGCRSSNNGASIIALGGGSQTLDFSAGGTLELTGGSQGSGNGALILADLSKGAQQTITSTGGAANYPSITLTGGSGGYFNPADGAAVTNNAAIASSSQLTAATASALKTINAKSITLNGGGSSSTHGGALLATGQGAAVVNVTGDLNMTGGASNVPLLAATNPANAYSRDQGAIAAINPDGKLTLTVGGNLTMQGGAGSSSGALIDANSANASVTVSVAGATRLMAGGSSSAILSHTGNSTAEPARGSVLIDLGSDGSLSTSTFAAAADAFTLNGTLTATGANPAAPLLPLYNTNPQGADWTVAGAKNLYAHVFANTSYVVHGALLTPQGNWLVELGAAAAAAADPATVLSYDSLASYGYQWTPAAYDSINASTLRFLLPADATPVDLRIADSAVNATCTSNAAMCASGAASTAPQASSTAPVTYDVKLAVADSTPPPAPAAPAAADEKPAAGVATAQVGIRSERAATREKAATRATEDSKSTAELKREALVASNAAKADRAAVRKVALVASKEAEAARAAVLLAARAEAEARRAAVTAQRAEADSQRAAGAVQQADAELRSAATPALKLAAQLRKADAEVRRVGAEARLAEVKVKQAEAAASRSTALAKGAEAEARQADASARAASAEATVAEAARSAALVQAREAKSPQQRAAAERLAEDKRADATLQRADSRVQLALADDLRLVASQRKVEADARRSQAQAGVREAQAQREEVQWQAASARGQQDAAQLQRALASGKPELVKAAQARQLNQERQLAQQGRKVESRKAAAEAQTAQARSAQAKADALAQQVAQRSAARRQRALQAFAANASASLNSEQLAERTVLRHAYKTEVFKEALTILSNNSHAADLPMCNGAVASVCIPSALSLPLPATLAAAPPPV
ncbi:MAG: filamentous hemagglutinin N-terminal domain-containing protein, partial [Sphingomonadaceae bacterium]